MDLWPQTLIMNLKLKETLLNLASKSSYEDWKGQSHRVERKETIDCGMKEIMTMSSTVFLKSKLKIRYIRIYE